MVLLLVVLSFAGCYVFLSLCLVYSAGCAYCLLSIAVFVFVFV